MVFSVKPGSKVCLLVNDITRLTKSDLFVPALVDELNACGIPDSDITVLFANGMHEQMSEADMRRIISDAAYERVNIVQHDCLNAEFVYVGTTTRGTEVRVNKVAYDADFLILTGGIVPHHIAGFGGGRKDIIPGCANAFGIFWMRQYCQNNVPRALMEAARIDGCSEWTIFFRVIAPILLPAYASLGIMNFVNQWNEFTQSLLILKKARFYTLPLLLRSMVSDRGNDYGAIMLASTCAVLPLLVIFLFASKYFMSGLTAGAVKGE